MAQIDFFFNSDEKRALLLFLQDKDMKFIPNLFYSNESYLTLRKIDECLPYLKQNQSFFLIHKSYFKEKLSLRKIVKEDRPQYYIRPRVCGPTIDIGISSNTEKKTGLIIWSDLSYYPYYWDKEGKHTTDAPPELKKIYSECVKFIKKQSVILKTLKRSYWVGQETLADLLAGKRLANVSDEFQDKFIRQYK